MLGKTPLVLSAEQGVKVSDNSQIQLKVALPGHVPRVVFADARTAQELHLKLLASENESFKADFSKDFGRELNKMIRESYEIQRLLQERKTPEAKVAVEKFKKDYPSLAYGYMIAAHLALREGKHDEARTNVLQARTLDPDDPAITQAFQLLRKRTQSP